MGRYLLTALILISAVSTVIADLSYLHAGNAAWPPHAKLHAVWGVLHVVATHTVAMWLLWQGQLTVLRIRVATAILLAYVVSFFATLMIAPMFGGATTPDVAPADLPPEPLGIDGNLFSFLLGLPFIVYGWWLAERDARAATA